MRRHGGRRTSPILAGILVALCLLARSQPASADPVTHGYDLLGPYSVTTSFFADGGTTEFSAWRADYPVNPTAMGIRYYERHGLITGTIMALFTILSGSMVAASPKSVESWESNGWRYTKTTYRSEAEKQQIQADAASSAAAMAGARNQSFEFTLFSRNLGGDTSGYKLNFFYSLSRPPFVFDAGFGFGSATAAATESGRFLVSDYTYYGMPLRVNYAAPWFVAFAQFEWNWASHSDSRTDEQSGVTMVTEPRAFPWRLGVMAAFFDRLQLEIAATTPTLTSGAFGFSGAVGMRF